MKSSIITIALAVALACSILAAVAQDSKPKEEKKLDGKTIFLNQKCNACHSIDSVGIARKTTLSAKIKPPDLSTVGTKRDSAFIVRWLQREETINGKKHLGKKFDGSDEEFKALVEWLASLKQKGKQ